MVLVGIMGLLTDSTGLVGEDKRGQYETLDAAVVNDSGFVVME